MTWGNRRDFLKVTGRAAALSAIGLAAPGCVHGLVGGKWIGTYDTGMSGGDVEGNIIENACRINTRFNLRAVSNGEEYKGVMNKRGMGFRKGNRLLTVSHLLQHPHVERLPAEMVGDESFTVELESVDAYLLDGTRAELLYNNPARDVAVLGLPEGYGSECLFGDPGMLEKGDVVMNMVTDPEEYDENIVKPAWVINTRPGLFWEMEEKGDNLPKGLTPDDMMLVSSIADILDDGDSGGPVYAQQGGAYRVVGMYIANVYSFNTERPGKGFMCGVMHRIDDILEDVGEYL